MEQMIKRLIGVGRVNAHRAETIKAGDLLMWNYGYVGEVMTVKTRGMTQIEITTRTLGRYGDLAETPGEATPRVMNRNTLVVKVTLRVEPATADRGVRRTLDVVPNAEVLAQ